MKKSTRMKFGSERMIAEQRATIKRIDSEFEHINNKRQEAIRQAKELIDAQERLIKAQDCLITDKLIAKKEDALRLGRKFAERRFGR